ncbi:MAG TPA: hypothetical protein DEP72_05200 [Clostridiales bacterium]|nr:MAG: hypothetical protein A2Y18_02350 [Clostridiales bacterium GWD2_32_19]HCC07538.1 hypothetical protein [Clostridiales bacterium]
MSKKSKVFIWIIATLSVVVIGLLFYQFNDILSVVNSDKIYTGITINNIEIGDLTKKEAFEKLLERDKEIFSTPILNLYYKNVNKDLYYDDIMADNNLEELIAKAFNIGREGTVIDRYIGVKKMVKNPQNLEIVYTPDKEKVFKVIESMKKEIEINPTNATMQKSKGTSFVIKAGIDGTIINSDKTFEDIKTALDEKETKAKVYVDVVKPEFTSKDLEKIQTQIATFSTNFNKNDISRSTNLQVATSLINGSIVKAGEIFSVNNTIKERTEANGYKTAHVIVNGEYVDGIGGGICQVATTLYNAVLLAELKVVERRNHSLTSAYVKPGRDATVSGSYLDFKFKNTTDKPIYLEGYISGGTINYTIYGGLDFVPKNKIDFESVVIKRIPPPPEKIVEDPTMEIGKRKVKEKSKEGMVVKLYKLTYDANNVLLKREYVSQSTYKPMQAEVLVGTKKPIAVTAATTVQEDNTIDTNVVQPITR